jgi:segregation and condensation protein A
MIVRELELDLDAFEGPFDLLLTLLLKEELEPGEIDMAAIVVAFVERLAEREELDAASSSC